MRIFSIVMALCVTLLVAQVAWGDDVPYVFDVVFDSTTATIVISVMERAKEIKEIRFSLVINPIAGADVAKPVKGTLKQLSKNRNMYVLRILQVPVDRVIFRLAYGTVPTAPVTVSFRNISATVPVVKYQTFTFFGRSDREEEKIDFSEDAPEEPKSAIFLDLDQLKEHELSIMAGRTISSLSCQIAFESESDDDIDVSQVGLIMVDSAWTATTWTEEDPKDAEKLRYGLFLVGEELKVEDESISIGKLIFSQGLQGNFKIFIRDVKVNNEVVDDASVEINFADVASNIARDNTQRSQTKNSENIIAPFHAKIIELKESKKTMELKFDRELAIKQAKIDALKEKLLLAEIQSASDKESIESMEEQIEGLSATEEQESVESKVGVQEKPATGTQATTKEQESTSKSKKVETKSPFGGVKLYRLGKN